MLTTGTVTTSNNPYPGLRPYQANEKTKFYGREADTQALLTKTLGNRLTLLFAATGVGKSSLLQAAILPELSAESGLNLNVVYYNDWIAPPIQGLQQAIRAALAKQFGRPIAVENTSSLEAFFRELTPNTSNPLVIILDQFEEFFRYRFIHHAADFQPFIDQLTEVILAPDLNVALVFSMREDFALELNAFKPHLPNPLFSNYYRLEKLGVDAAKEAITEPLIQAGYSYEPALLDELLKDLLSRDLSRDAASLAKGMQADSVEPPYLQIVCSQLWELDKNDPQKTLRLATYQKAGGAKGLLENYVNYVMKSFSDREKQVASKAFDHLISRRGTKMAHTPEDLAELVNIKPSELAKVMDKLEKARILRRQQRDQQVWYELYHDMFSGGIEHWNTAWKNHMRLRRTVIATAASLVALAGVYFGVVAYLQSTSKHLRLGNSNTDRVEIYTGTSKFPDPFNQQHYFSEASMQRSQLELDKRYAKRDIPDYPLVVRDLISSQPVDSRIDAYIKTGYFCQFSDLLTQALPLESAAPGCQLANEKRRDVKSTQTSANQPDKITELNINGDPMQAIMLQQLVKLRTEWGFEQRQNLLKLLPQDQGSLLEDPDITKAFNEPVTLSSEEMLKKTLNRLGMLIYDPRQLEVVLNWILNPTPIANSNQMSEVDIAANLLNNYQNLPSLVQAVVETVDYKKSLRAALQSDDPQTREVASVLSGRLGDKTLIAPLTQRLQDKVPSVRLAALKSLLTLNPEQAIPLASTLLNDRSQSMEIRLSLFTSLAEIESPQVIPIFLARFQDNNEREEIRMMSASTLGQLGVTEALPLFRAILSNTNEQTYARNGAVEAIRLMNDTDSIDLLLARLNDPDERSDIRANCAFALSNLGANQAVSSLLNLVESPNTNENLKNSAISALGFLDDPSIVPRLEAYQQTLPAFSNLTLQLDWVLDSLNETTPAKPSIDSAVLSSGALASSSSPAKTSLVQDVNAANYKTVSYEGINPALQANTYSNINSVVTGSAAQKQALRTALSITDANRNPALLRLALNEDYSVSLRTQALSEIKPSQISAENQALTQGLSSLAKNQRRLLREASKNALLRVAEGKDLVPWLKTVATDQANLDAALLRLSQTSSRPEAIQLLLAFAQDEQSNLQAKAIQLLGDMQATEALDFLETSLKNLEDETQKWRKIRDQQPDELADDASYEAWQQNLAAAEPKHADLAASYGYALAAMSNEQALAMLAHDLADVRLGASLSVSKNANVKDLQALSKQYAIRSNEPFFQEASYKAIDEALNRLESSTDPAQIQDLSAWQQQVSVKATDAIAQRLNWTLTMIKYYQSLDQTFATRYHLKRSQ